jgi:hypothetical protein
MPEGKNRMDFWQKTVVSLHRCVMIEIVFSDMISVVVPKSARVGRSVDYQLTITSRLFTRLTMFSFECISSEPV